MTINRKKALFDHLRKSLAAAGLATARDDSLICPLCWQETRYEDLSHEHVVPGSVGGTCNTLTCRPCNNEHGSSLDSHLSNASATQSFDVNVRNHDFENVSSASGVLIAIQRSVASSCPPALMNVAFEILKPHAPLIFY